MDRIPSSSEYQSTEQLMGSQSLSEHFSTEELADYQLSSYPSISKIRISDEPTPHIYQPKPEPFSTQPQVSTHSFETTAHDHRKHSFTNPSPHEFTSAGFQIGQKRKAKQILPLGNSELMQHIRMQIGQVSNFDVSVLITGASGAGKEVVAQQIHKQSTRSDKPFVAINCGAIPDDLLESELFGHEKGAFTGAISARIGRFEMAQGGTLFLDEIGDMPLVMQVKLLRVLQEKCFERIGGNKTISADVRIIAATHRNLPEFIKQGKFREDLFYRLNVFPMYLSPLQERKEDVTILFEYFMQKLDDSLRFTVPHAVMAVLHDYHWPGNVRELENVVQRLAIIGQCGEVSVKDLPEQIRMSTSAELARHQQQYTSIQNSGGHVAAMPTRNIVAQPIEPNLSNDIESQIQNYECLALNKQDSQFNEGHQAPVTVSPHDLIDDVYGPSFNRIKTDALAEKKPSFEAGGVTSYFSEHEMITETQVLDAALSATLGSDGVDVKLLLQEIEVSYILKALDRTGGVVAKAARLLNLRRTTLVEKMKKMNISV